MTGWQVLFGRPGTPGDAMGGTARAARRALADPTVQQRLVIAGCEIWPDSSPSAAGALLRAEIAPWTPTVAAMKLNPG